MAFLFLEPLRSAPMIRHFDEPSLERTIPGYRPADVQNYDTHFGSIWLHRRRPTKPDEQATPCRWYTLASVRSASTDHTATRLGGKMPRNEEIFSVLVGSPSDVSEERDLLRGVVDEVNRSHARRSGVRLELLGWEDVAPDFGDDPQDVINRRLPSDYDVFIGILWNRIGSPTNRASSGTIEEFRLAKARYDKDPNSVRLMLYFKDSPPPTMDDFDPDQYKSVQEFRKEVSQVGGLYRRFSTASDFSNRVRVDLTEIVCDRRLDDDPPDCAGAACRQADAEEDEAVCDSVASDEVDDGLLDLEEMFEEQMGAMNAVLTRMGEAIEEVGSSLRGRAEALQALGLPEDGSQLSAEELRRLRAQAKRVLKQGAVDMSKFVRRTRSELPLLRQHLDRGMETFTRAIPIYLELDGDAADWKSSGGAMLEALDGAHRSVQGFHDTVEDLPRLTSSLVRAKRETEKVLQELLEILRGGRSALGAALSLLG